MNHYYQSQGSGKRLTAKFKRISELKNAIERKERDLRYATGSDRVELEITITELKNQVENLKQIVV